MYATTQFVGFVGLYIFVFVLHCNNVIYIYIITSWYVYIYIPIGSMYAIYGNIYHQYIPNVSIYTIHGSYGYIYISYMAEF